MGFWVRAGGKRFECFSIEACGLYGSGRGLLGSSNRVDRTSSLARFSQGNGWVRELGEENLIGNGGSWKLVKKETFLRAIAMV